MHQKITTLSLPGTCQGGAQPDRAQHMNLFEMIQRENITAIPQQILLLYSLYLIISMFHKEIVLLP